MSLKRSRRRQGALFLAVLLLLFSAGEALAVSLCRCHETMEQGHHGEHGYPTGHGGAHGSQADSNQADEPADHGGLACEILCALATGSAPPEGVLHLTLSSTLPPLPEAVLRIGGAEELHLHPHPPHFLPPALGPPASD